MTKGTLIITMIYKTNINNNKDGSDENKSTEDHSVLELPCPKKDTIYQIDFYLVVFT